MNALTDAASETNFTPYEPWTSWEQITAPQALRERDLQEV